MRSVFSIVLGCLSLVAGTALAQEPQNNLSIPHIRVTGKAKTEVKPDIAFLTLGVVSEKPTPSDAVAQNAKSTSELVADIKGQGIDPKDIRTESLNLSKLETLERDPRTNIITKRTVTGYQAKTLFRVQIHDVERAGEIVRHFIEHGANTYRNLHFWVSDRDMRLDGLRENAVANARYQAELYAKGGRVKLGRLLTINTSPNYGDNAAELRSAPPEGTQVVTPIPIEPGLQTIDLQVEVTWELLPE